MEIRNAFREVETALVGLPADFAWQEWVDRWESMQDTEVPNRQRRMKLMADLLAVSSRPGPIIDLGAGPGSLAAAIRDASILPDATLVEANPFLAFLAEQRFASDPIVRVLHDDLNAESLWEGLSGPFEAALSVTAFHWFDAARLDRLARRLARCVRPGGLLLVSDSVSSERVVVQDYYRRVRDESTGRRPGEPSAWQRFWVDAGATIAVDMLACFANVDDPGVGDDGLPFGEIRAVLRAAGWSDPEVHWADCGEIVFSCLNRGPVPPNAAATGAPQAAEPY